MLFFGSFSKIIIIKTVIQKKIYFLQQNHYVIWARITQCSLYIDTRKPLKVGLAIHVEFDHIVCSL